MKGKVIFFASLLLLSGCISYYLAPVPLRVVRHQLVKTPGTDTLVVFLPGNKMDPEEFMEQGFPKILARAHVPLDSWAVDARLGYYIKKTLPGRLMADVIAPAKIAGYRHIWLVGISMGGSGALWFAKEHPETVKGIVLLSPFLADEPVINEIAKAGGVRAWQPVMPLEPGDHQRAQWLWLKEYPANTKTLPVIILGFGTKDRFAESNRLMAGILPSHRVFEIPGDHDWPTWRTIFEKVVAGGLFEK